MPSANAKIFFALFPVSIIVTVFSLFLLKMLVSLLPTALIFSKSLLIVLSLKFRK